MVEIKRYGVTSDEQNAEWMLKCRQITRTVIDFGVTEREKLKIIYLLALELENREYLQELTSLIKRLEAGEKRSTLITEIE